MKKIFYSMMAVALCACSQSDVDEVVTPPQPENNGLKFEVVDNGFIGEDGTRVTYGEYGAADNGAYKATFEDGDAIGIYAIISGQIDTETGLPKDAAYTEVRNVKLTLSGNTWKSDGPITFPEDADLLFAYAPYSKEDYTLGSDGKPKFTKNTSGEWELDTKTRNAFFVGHNLYDNGTVTKNGTKEDFEKVDMMGAVAKLPSAAGELVTLNMKHMRGMIELTTPKEVTLTDLRLKVNTDVYVYDYYIYNEKQQNRTKNVYRILTTEYRSANTLCATIKDGGIVKKYQQTLNNKEAAGYCSRVRIEYTPAPVIEVGEGKTLEAALKAKYGDDYATDAALTSLRVKGTLQGTNAQSGDWATLRSLTTLTTLDMSELTNEETPYNWLNGTEVSKTLTTLVLPNGLKKVGQNSLAFPGGNNPKVISIELPASVTELVDGAFYHSAGLSLRIPEDSNLKTIGTSALDGLKAVYTDAGNPSVLKIPASVAKIAGAAFYGVNQLKKIIFQSNEAPEIAANAFAAVNAIINVPARATYEGKFPGKTVFVGPILTVDNYTAVDVDGNPITREGSLNALCDGPQQTYWHSDYNSTHTYDKWGIYIDITLPKAYSNLKLSYTTRHNGNGQLPKKVIIGVATDNETFTEAGVYDATTDATVLPTNANETKELAISATSSYNKVRFGVTRSAITVNPPADAEAEKDANGFYITDETLTKKVKAWFALSELTVYEETWTEPAQ